jgi:hypothetical protein
MKIRSYVVGCLGLAPFLGILNAQIIENWDDGNDTAPLQQWTRWTVSGLGQTFTFPTSDNGTPGYRLSGQTGSQINPGRMGSYISSLPPIPDFTLSVELHDWDNAQSQNMGIWARVQTPLPPSIPYAYALHYANRFSSGNGGTDQLRISFLTPSGVSLLTGSQGVFGVNGASAAPTPDKTYKLVFSGYGSALEGRIYESTDNGATWSAMWMWDGSALKDYVFATHSTLTSGQVGVVTWVGSIGVTGQGAQNPLFDNFVVIPEPSAFALTALGLAGLALMRLRRQCR